MKSIRSLILLGAVALGLSLGGCIIVPTTNSCGSSCFGSPSCKAPGEACTSSSDCCGPGSCSGGVCSSNSTLGSTCGCTTSAQCCGALLCTGGHCQ